MDCPISTNVREDGTLEIYLRNRLLAEVSDRTNDEEAIEDILCGMGYEWRPDGTITEIKESL